MADVFISYARATAEAARSAAVGLRDQGYSVWIDDALQPHRDFSSVIEENLREAKAVLVLWSAEARASRWVPAEADLAHERGTLVQLSLDGAAPPFPFNRMHCEMASGWRGDLGAPAWRKVRDSIAALSRSDAPDRTTPARADRGRSPAPRPVLERLLGVLAFDNLSDDPELADFCDGISEEIQQTVARGAELKVVARSSSFQFRGADKAVDKVAAALRTTHLLDGSVRRSGSRVRITAQLVDCAEGSTLWANRFDGDLSDVFALQDRIAEAVAQALALTLATRRSAEPIPPEIYEVFLRARGLMSESSRLFGEAVPDAEPPLERVVQAAPDYAPAWELLALSRAWTLRSYQRPADAAGLRARALAAVDTALRLDPKRSGAYVALSMLQPWGAYGERERLLNEALRVGPNDPGALTELSTLCWSVGRFKDALAFAERACEINPLMPSALLHVAQMRLYVGEYNASIRMHRELRRRWPLNPAILGSLVNCSAAGDAWEAYDEAIADIDKFEGWQKMALRTAQKWAEARRSGDPALRHTRLRRYTELFDNTGFLPLNLVESLSELGFVDEAMDLALRSSYAVFDPEAPVPTLAFPGVIMARGSALNKTTRFIELCDTLGLCAYWTESERWPDCVAWTPYDFRSEVGRRLAEPAYSP